MEVVSTIAAARALLDRTRHGGGTVGLVPTMGYLHDGHASLVRRSAADNDLTMTTIFVNPLQFAPTEDLAAYPRDLDRDLAICDAAGAGVVLAPPVEEMYPQPVLTTVAVPDIAAPLEGVERPSHFAGVATVVAKLFNIAGPCRAYFGEKDWQQLQIVTRMAADLSFQVDVVGCAIVREADGLAMSSRNIYLDGDDRRAAPVLYRALCAGRDAIEAGERDPSTVRDVMRAVFAAEPRAALGYAEVVEAASLKPLTTISGDVRLLTSARLGPARLIDNVGVTVADR